MLQRLNLMENADYLHIKFYYDMTIINGCDGDGNAAGYQLIVTDIGEGLCLSKLRLIHTSH